MLDTLSMIKHIIIKVLSANDIKGEINDDTKLIEDYAVDSIMAIEILVSIEEKFNITINDDDLDLALLETPKSLFDYVNNKLNV